MYTFPEEKHGPQSILKQYRLPNLHERSQTATSVSAPVSLFPPVLIISFWLVDSATADLCVLSQRHGPPKLKGSTASST